MTQKLFTKNFILLILGQLTSLFGNFILKLALSMYVLEATGSAAIFAGILSVATIPTIILSPLGGILADRAYRRNIMVALDALTGISILCATLLLAERNDLAVISVLLMILSVLGAFETPTVQACIPTMLLLTAFSRFFVMGITIVGLPYIARTVLGFHAQYYGAAESALAVATILGSVAAGLLTIKLRIHRLSILLASMGIFMIPAGIAFLSVSVKYLDQRTKATQISQFDLVLEKVS